MSLFTKGAKKKWLKIVGYGPGGSGKTTFGTTMPESRYWVDSEHSGDHIRDDNDPVLHTTSFKDLQDGLQEAKAANVASFIIDPITIFREALIDKVESETKYGLQFKDWAKIKKPDKRLTTDWQNMAAHVYLTVHEKDEFEMVKNDKGKLEPVKIGVKPDADKKLIYAPDIVLRFYVENGKHFAVIEKIRIRKEIALKTGLTVGKVIENPTFEHFKPIAEAYAQGTEQAHYSDDRETSTKDEAVFDDIDKEGEQAAHKKIIGQIERAEKKLSGMKVFGFRDAEEIEGTRKTAFGTTVLSDALVTDLELYYKGVCDAGIKAKQESNQ